MLLFLGLFSFEVSALELKDCLEMNKIFEREDGSAGKIETTETGILIITVKKDGESFKARKDLKGGYNSSIHYSKGNQRVEEVFCMNDVIACHRLRDLMITQIKKLEYDELSGDYVNCSQKILNSAF